MSYNIMEIYESMKLIEQYMKKEDWSIPIILSWWNIFQILIIRHIQSYSGKYKK